MGKWWVGLMMAIGLVGLQLTPALAEGERKTLEELLFDKGVITKDEAATLQGRKLATWVDKLIFSGDFRLRDETFYNNAVGTTDRHRERFRLRLATDLKVQDFTVGVRLASGTGEQVSTNKSFDGLSTQTALYVDRAFLRWQSPDVRWVALTGGRMPNPFFTVYSSDAVWDDDFNPEGFAENFAFKPSGKIGVFLNLAQIVLDEDSAGALNTDQWLWGQQVGLSMEPFQDVKATIAGAYYKAANAKSNDFGQNIAQTANSRALPVAPATTSNVLANDFDIMDLTGSIGLKAGGMPVALMGDVVRNMNDTRTNAGVPTEHRGYQTGLIVGKASDPQTWELAYFYKLLGADATLSDIADSDFGNGGTGRMGHIMWVAYNPTKALQFKTKYFITRLEDQRLAESDIKRLQVDLSIKF
ncbi:MAG: putative porin [Nitrospirae bacterium]|nr:putative porin [Nitrospirota bacterium]